MTDTITMHTDIDIDEPDYNDQQRSWCGTVDFFEAGVSPATQFYLRSLEERLNNNQTLTDAEKSIYMNWKTLRNQGQSMALTKLLVEIEEQCSFEERNQFKEKSIQSVLENGYLFHGAGHYSEFGVNLMHELLNNAYGIQSGLQQGGLQGTEPDSPELIKSEREKIKALLSTICRSLGEDVIFND